LLKLKLLQLVEWMNIIVSTIYTRLFNKLENKKIFLKFKLFELSQKFLIIFYNKIHKNIQMTLKLKNNKNIPKVKSRKKNLFLVSKNIVEFAIKNDINHEDVFKNLDQVSRKTINRVLKRMQFLYTNSIIDKKILLIKDELNKKKQINEIIEAVKKEIILENKKYQRSVFYSHNGLKFLPQDKKNTIINRDFLDCGAFNGDSSIVFEIYYKPYRIYAFEPEPKNYKSLVDTIKINNLKKIMPLRLGLGKKECFMKIKSRAGSSFLSDKGEHQVQITTIDNFVKENNLTIGLIKMDIEGNELEALKGAEETLKANNYPPIIFEANEGPQHEQKRAELFKHLQNYKYLIAEIRPFKNMYVASKAPL